jgi:hypothetical protein
VESSRSRHDEYSADPARVAPPRRCCRRRAKRLVGSQAPPGRSRSRSVGCLDRWAALWCAGVVGHRSGAPHEISAPGVGVALLRRPRCTAAALLPERSSPFTRAKQTVLRRSLWRVARRSRARGSALNPHDHPSQHGICWRPSAALVRRKCWLACLVHEAFIDGDQFNELLTLAPMIGMVLLCPGTKAPPNLCDPSRGW